jgi:translation initiation factor 3 subunit K
MIVSPTSPSSSCEHDSHFCKFFSLCLSLLCLRYQFNPELYNPDVVINILIKALTASPSPDFNLCVSLLDERPTNAPLEEPDPLPTLLPVLRGLHDLIFRCRFPAFWDIYRSDELETLRDNYTVEVVGFDNAVRDVVVRAVKAAFTQISIARLSSYLALSGESKGEEEKLDSMLICFLRR